MLIFLPKIQAKWAQQATEELPSAISFSRAKSEAQEAEGVTP